MNQSTSLKRLGKHPSNEDSFPLGQERGLASRSVFLLRSLSRPCSTAELISQEAGPSQNVTHREVTCSAPSVLHSGTQVLVLGTGGLRSTIQACTGTAGGSLHWCRIPDWKGKPLLPGWPLPRQDFDSFENCCLDFRELTDYIRLRWIKRLSCIPTDSLLLKKRTLKNNLSSWAAGRV